MARDIDLLVPRRDLVRVGQRLREAGFTSHEDLAWAGDDALQFRARFLGLMAWVSPEGVLLEIPSSLDAEWGRLPTDEIIAEAESVTIGGVPIRVIRGLDFFTYLCRHHTRHHWARLHWIADLDAIIHSPGFDLASAKAQARRRGFGRTVDAACAIHRAAAEPEPWNAAFDDPFAREVFRHCLMNLEGDYAKERELRAAFPTTDIDIEPARRWLLWRQHVFDLIGQARLPALQAPLFSGSGNLHGLWADLQPVCIPPAVAGLCRPGGQPDGCGKRLE
jgi:hypothetical protein